MGRSLRKCEELGEEADMEKEEKTAMVTGRKRKVGFGESQVFASPVQLKTRRLAVVTPENSASSACSGNSTCESVSSDHVLASCCSSNGSSELAKGCPKVVDLEENEATVQFFAASTGDSLDCRERREGTPLSEVQAESGELESTARPHESISSRLSAEKMPSEAELDEFFAAAEKNFQKEFIEKYNYDIVKDQPLEGRYEWVQIQLKP